MSVPVNSATSSALVDTGEQRSPTKMPERTAPPMRLPSMPRLRPIVAQMTPIVAAEPSAVPVSVEIAPHRRKVISR